jgi:pimeloyl-ACP methyl ester carboxylesterase
MPAELAEITEPAAQQMAARMQRTPVPMPSLPIPSLETAFVGPSKQQQAQLKAVTNAPPVVLLHGFDSSCLEFRRLYPLLESRTETWAVDLVGVRQQFGVTMSSKRRAAIEGYPCTMAGILPCTLVTASQPTSSNGCPGHPTKSQ